MKKKRDRRPPSAGIKGQTSPESLLVDVTTKLTRLHHSQLTQISKITGKPKGAIARQAILQYLRQQNKLDIAA
jgi:hypothetical protein